MKKTKTIMTSILALGVLSATPVLGAAYETGTVVSAAEQFKVLDMATVDQKYVNAAQKAIEQHGNGKKFKLDQVEKLDDIYYFQTKMSDDFTRSDAYVHVDAKTGKVVMMNLKFNIDEVTGPYMKYLKSAQTAVKQINPKSTFQIKTMSYYWDKKQDMEFVQFFGNDADNNDGQSIRIHPKTNQIIGYKINFNPADMDKAIISTAEKAVKSMPNTKFEPFTSALLVKNGDAEERWIVAKQKESINDTGEKLVNEMKSVYVEIGETSGNIYRVKVVPQSNNSKQALTNDQVKSTAKPIINKLMGIDISNYKLDNDSGLEYKFSSKGKDSIHVYVSGNQIYEIKMNVSL